MNAHDRVDMDAHDRVDMEAKSSIRKKQAIGFRRMEVADPRILRDDLHVAGGTFWVDSRH